MSKNESRIFSHRTWMATCGDIMLHLLGIRTEQGRRALSILNFRRSRVLIRPMEVREFRLEGLQTARTTRWPVLKTTHELLHSWRFDGHQARVRLSKIITWSKRLLDDSDCGYKVPIDEGPRGLAPSRQNMRQGCLWPSPSPNSRTLDGPRSAATLPWFRIVRISTYSAL